MSLVLEGFAGPGGWSEALRLCGFTEVAGYELDPDACQTASRAGHCRVLADVSALRVAHLADRVEGLVMSPPCPPWSQSGRRLGPLDRVNVLRRIDVFAEGGIPRLAEWHDPRSHLCAEPMRWAAELRPRWIALEQVPGALPLWQHIGRHLETMGYSVATGVLRCEEYGVPQTRRRALLVARRDGLAVLPSPTHRRYGAMSADRRPGARGVIGDREQDRQGVREARHSYDSADRGGRVVARLLGQEEVRR